MKEYTQNWYKIIHSNNPNFRVTLPASICTRFFRLIITNNYTGDSLGIKWNWFGPIYRARKGKRRVHEVHDDLWPSIRKILSNFMFASNIMIVKIYIFKSPFEFFIICHIRLKESYILYQLSWVCQICDSLACFGMYCFLFYYV